MDTSLNDELPTGDMNRIRPRDEDVETEQPPAKRSRVEEPAHGEQVVGDTTLLNGAGGLSGDPATERMLQAPSVTSVQSSLNGPSRSSSFQTQPSRYSTENLHPPSLALLALPPLDSQAFQPAREVDVGITEYVSQGVPVIEGIIKQRFTDFLVFEVDLEGNVVRLKDIGPPKDDQAAATVPQALQGEVAEDIKDNNAAADQADRAESTGLEPGAELSASEPAAVSNSGGALPTKDPSESSKAQTGNGQTKFSNEEWSDENAQKLSPFLSSDALSQLEKMYKEGREPPLVSDQGWAGRKAKVAEPEGGALEGADGEAEVAAASEGGSRGKRGRGGRDRGGRGGRGGAARGRGRGGANVGGGRKDTRKVVSDPITSKADRGNLHKMIREMFGGRLETETLEEQKEGEEGSRVAIKWNHWPTPGGARGRAGRGGGPRRERDPALASVGSYIHFTLQKTNRDTQDALGHIARQIKCSHKDLQIAGTKDKRGVTVQRVSLKRHGRTLQEVWKSVNGVGRKRSEHKAVSNRGERGVRIADLTYSKSYLDLGMLKGNEFVITLRNVKVDTLETLDRAMTSLKDKGFINYYGMQRFGTSAVPTHAIGLALLHSDWERAVSLLLMPRPGEDPQCEAARRAWLENKDIVQALLLMPRRVVAERNILEYYKKWGADNNHLVALSTIPRNLRMMYVHAYQSYVWNAMVSERIRRYGSDAPVAGDLVFDTTGPTVAESAAPEMPAPTADAPGNEEDMPADAEVEAEEELVLDAGVVEQEDFSSGKTRGRKGDRPRVKVLAEADLPNYTIFDVVMPLPGFDIAIPGGDLGELYKAFLKADGLAPEQFQKSQKEYSLAGSYRKIMHQPKHVSWSALRYTDPDVPLVQSDEDKILGFDAPVIDENGKFLALQIRLTLGTAAYATMALREVTKTDTSSQAQTALTLASEDQLFKGAIDPAEGGVEDVEMADVPESTDGLLDAGLGSAEVAEAEPMQE